jgi:hypothetical protein
VVAAAFMAAVAVSTAEADFTEVEAFMEAAAFTAVACMKDLEVALSTPTAASTDITPATAFTDITEASF